MHNSEATNYDPKLKALIQSIKNGETEKTLELIKKIPTEDLFYPDGNGRTHLQNAITLGMNDVASAIIRKKGVTARQLLSRDKDGISAIDDAIRLERGSLIVEIFANKEINSQIHHSHLPVVLDKDESAISNETVPRETIIAAQKVVNNEIKKYKIQHLDGLLSNSEVIAKRAQDIKEGEIEYLNEMYRRDSSLVRESTMREKPLLLTYKSRQKQG